MSDSDRLKLLGQEVRQALQELGAVSKRAADLLTKTQELGREILDKDAAQTDRLRERGRELNDLIDAAKAKISALETGQADLEQFRQQILDQRPAARISALEDRVSALEGDTA